MLDLTIEREIVIDASVDVVWRTITEPEQIALWFAERVQLELRPVGGGTLTFDNQSSAEVVNAALIVETVDPPRRFSFRWGHPEGEEPGAANSTRVEFTLVAASGERTRLRVKETGLDDVDWPDHRKAQYTTDHRQGWEFYLGRLRQRFATPA